MTYERLIEELRSRQALIVHFSHHAKMRGGGVFPADLHAAIANSRNWPLSSTVVWPHHRMPLVGSVGVVLHPRSLASVVRVAGTDGGSLTWNDGTEGGLGGPLSDDSLQQTFDPPEGHYNEWRMRECDVIGIYYEGSPPEAKKHVMLEIDGQPVGPDISAEPITPQEIYKAFPELPIYTRHAGELVATRIPGSVVYPWPLTSAPAPTRP